MDIPLLVIVLLLTATLLAFFTGSTPYPFGVIILCVFLIGRLLYLRSRR